MLEGYIRFVRRVLPSPFSIAVFLTIFSFLTVWIMGLSGSGSIPLADSMNWWSTGLWDGPLMVFAMQMMLMLVLGHVLALTPFFDRLIRVVVGLCTSTARAALVVSLLTMLVALFNWGLGLIFGAILARKVGEHFSAAKKPLNYALVGAAGYAGLMIWHGGISGSALIKAAEPGNLASLMSGILPEAELTNLPQNLGLGETVFSMGNIVVCGLVLLLLPLVLYYVGKRSEGEVQDLGSAEPDVHIVPQQLVGAEHIDHSAWMTRIIGGLATIYCGYLLFKGDSLLDFFNPNNINLLLLALCLLLHRSFYSFLSAVEQAIVGASGILIQFPLYFGIMGLIKGSGLVTHISEFFVSISNETTYPLFTYLSAGLVNIFVPSGGGQWVVQGPIILQSSMDLGIPLHKSVLALAYGDQITNMLQPFWALPLLGITKLSARDILPYTLVMFLVGFTVYLVGLLVII